MNAVIAGRDCFAVMPTGGGKSACYFLPGLLQNGVTIVISPLNALIFDQINYLKSHGVIDFVRHIQLLISKFLNFMSRLKQFAMN